MPIKNTFPTGKSVGGVSERAGAKAGGSNPSATDSFACRDGRRHPGLREGGALRGASSERGSRSVRSLPWASSHGRNAPTTADVRRAPRRGTPSAYENQAYAPYVGTRDCRPRQGDASFTRSLGPCTLILTTLRGRKPRRWGIRGSIAVGQTCASRRNRHRGYGG